LSGRFARRSLHTHQPPRFAFALLFWLNLGQGASTMRRLLILLIVVGVVALLRVLAWTVLPPSIGFWIKRAIDGLLSLACPLFWLTIWFAPGVIYGLRDDLDELWQRLKGRRSEIDDLTRRIAHLRKPHHMAQLGVIYQQQGRHKLAADWFAQALEGDGTLVDARYRLALCRMRAKRFGEAAELLEQVYAVKPDHDYGGLYLRLAQASDLAGHAARAAEIYPVLLKFYPGHPEGCYSYGRLLERLGRLSEARQQMQQVIFSVRNAPSFQRRRNRHWMWKAKWWLWTKRTRDGSVQQ
jgi:hypothetical protein